VWQSNASPLLEVSAPQASVLAAPFTGACGTEMKIHVRLIRSFYLGTLRGEGPRDDVMLALPSRNILCPAPERDWVPK